MSDERVRDIMLQTPKTLGATATVADARALFASPKTVSIVVADGSRFVGMLSRSDVPTLLPDSSPIHTFARRDVPTMTAEQSVAEVWQLLNEHNLTRVAVLEDDGATLAGLVCLNRRRTGFCRD